MKRILALLFVFALILSIAACGQSTGNENQTAENGNSGNNGNGGTSGNISLAPDGFVHIKGGTFTMGSPESEGWRGSDETQHSVTVSDFYTPDW